MTSLHLPNVVRVHKALAHPARVRILAMLRTGELCACQIAAVLALAPSTVSAHLAELRRAGLLAERKEGRWVHYRAIETEDAGEIGDWVWRRIKRDPQVHRDASTVRRLRAVPVDELCRMELDLTRLGVSRET